MILEQPITEADDAQLARAARTDSQAFEMLYRRHVTAVYRYCLMQTRSQADAEDVTAQTFLAALEGLPRYRGRGSFAAWVFGIARRKCADYHRGKYGHPVDRLETTIPLLDPAAVDMEQQAYLNSILDCVQQALTQLNPNRREALYLRFWGGLSVRETAAAMRRSPGAVKMLVSRAVADLKERCLSHE